MGSLGSIQCLLLSSYSCLGVNVVGDFYGKKHSLRELEAALHVNSVECSNHALCPG